MTKYHRLDSGMLGQLATGLGGPEVLAELQASRLSRHLLLLKHVWSQWPVDRTLSTSAVTTLGTVQQRCPALFRQLLTDPLVGAWLAITVRRLGKQNVDPDQVLPDLLHLGAVAAAGAALCGIDADVVGYARGGRLTLPLLGDFVVDVDGPVTLSVSSGRVISPEPLGFHPLHRLGAAEGPAAWQVVVEDGNPYRNAYHVPARGRLTEAEADDWQALFRAASALLAEHLPDRLTELSIVLRSIIPLQEAGPGVARSGTAHDSVGALGLTRPHSAEEFVVTLVHECQHSKLSAVLDLHRMYEVPSRELHFAPWREDPRPTSGLIQGVYAFLAVADTWRGLAAVPSLRAHATLQYAETREHLDAGLRALESSTELTRRGRSFTAGMRMAFERLPVEGIPPHVADQARASLEQRRRDWTARHDAQGAS